MEGTTGQVASSSSMVTWGPLSVITLDKIHQRQELVLHKEKTWWVLILAELLTFCQPNHCDPTGLDRRGSLSLSPRGLSAGHPKAGPVVMLSNSY